MSKTEIKNSSIIIRVIKARSKLVVSILLGILVAVFIPSLIVQKEVTRIILGWNAGALIYLLFTFKLMFWSTHEKIQEQARRQDEGRILILILVILAAIATLGAIVSELALSRNIIGASRYLHIALAGVTILTSWFFTHVMFAQHYAHDFYMASDLGLDGGLSFPRTQKPDYLDFLYFSCVIGTSGQTADVSFTSKLMRRTGLVHCVLAFFFNTTLLALTINIASGLF